MQHSNPLIEENLIVVRQGLELLEQMDDNCYATVCHPFSSHGIGSHFRHCIDFYDSFLTGLNEGIVDYDQRKRVEALGKNRSLAHSRLTEIHDAIESLPSDLGRMPLLVRLEHAGDEHDMEAWSESSVRRELQSLVSHTVHHYALIGLMLQLNGFTVAPDFGVAPSTLKHWRQPSLCAQ